MGNDLYRRPGVDREKYCLPGDGTEYDIWSILNGALVPSARLPHSFFCLDHVAPGPVSRLSENSK